MLVRRRQSSTATEGVAALPVHGRGRRRPTLRRRRTDARAESVISVAVVERRVGLRADVVSRLAVLPGFEVVISGGSIAAIDRLIQARMPDVVVLDLGIAGLDDSQTVPTLSSRGARVVVVPVTADADEVSRALDAGAADSVSRAAEAADIVSAVRAVAAARAVRAWTGTGVPDKAVSSRRRSLWALIRRIGRIR